MNIVGIARLIQHVLDLVGYSYIGEYKQHYIVWIKYSWGYVQKKKLKLHDTPNKIYRVGSIVWTA